MTYNYIHIRYTETNACTEVRYGKDNEEWIFE